MVPDMAGFPQLLDSIRSRACDMANVAYEPRTTNAGTNDMRLSWIQDVESDG